MHLYGTGFRATDAGSLLKDRPVVDEHGSTRKEVLCGGKLEDERD
jgi:hypothetical protein